jgi:hypothetical protein
LTIVIGLLDHAPGDGSLLQLTRKQGPVARIRVAIVEILDDRYGFIE